MRSATEMRRRPCSAAKAAICGHFMTVPSSFASSQIAATGGSSARRQRSTAASVWPERMSTPPSLAISGKTCPGRTKSDAPMLWLASARTVFERCSAEMPVVSPCRVSTETVKAVPSGASFVAKRQRRADDAAGVADDERHLLRRAQRRRDGEVALALAVLVVGHDDDLAAGEGLDRLGDGAR